MSDGLLRITVDDSAWRDYLKRLHGRLGDLTEPLDDIGALLESRIASRFETESGPDGSPWAPWAASTRQQYPEDGNARILDRYGDMLSSLNRQADATSVRVGFGQPYAAFHEWGTKRMPRRGLIFEDPDAGRLNAEDNQLIAEVLLDWLDRP